MVKRRGVSLLNVMVFMVFAVMLTAQVFFFAKNAVDEAADEREMMMYRMNLDSLVQEAEEALRNNEIDPHKDNVIKYTDFYDKTKVWSNSDDTVRIHDLDYNFEEGTFSPFDRDKWKTQSGSNMHKKVFAVMPPLSYDTPVVVDNGDGTTTTNHNYTVTHSYYLIRAWIQLPENFYNMRLMYQVLVKRNINDYTDLQTLSFQEIWFPDKEGNE